MGSTRVSEVAGIMSIGQGGQTLTGTKEGDLKVQFAEVMSQMTTQVGGGTIMVDRTADRMWQL